MGHTNFGPTLFKYKQIVWVAKFGFVEVYILQRGYVMLWPLDETSEYWNSVSPIQAHNCMKYLHRLAEERLVYPGAFELPLALWAPADDGILLGQCSSGDSSTYRSLFSDPRVEVPTGVTSR